MSKRYRAEAPEVTEEVTPVPAEEETPQVEVTVPGPVKAGKGYDRDAFIERRLKVINEWPDGAKKRAAVDRLLRRKEV